MDERQEKLLRKTAELTKENNRMLHAMRRNAFIGGVFKFLWLAILIGVPVYIYFNFFQPVLEDIGEAYRGVQSGAQDVQLKLQDVPFIGGYFAPEGPSAE
jgi:hypothetical protein